VDVRMVGQCLSPGVEYRKTSCFHSKKVWIESGFLHSKCTGGKKQVIAELLIEVEKGPK
jgi:hypothetical protein